MAPALEDAEKERPTRPKVGDLGRYRLIAELARGGMGIVYLALVRGPGGFNKLFVVKELKGHLAEDPNLVRMFVEEARLAAKLNHPNVVQTIEVGSEWDRHFIAMEFLDGQSLNRVLSRLRRSGAPFPLLYHLHVLAHLLEGLRYAHGLTDFDGSVLHLVHRDVSPHNVFLTYDGQVKVLDFGIAKALDSAHDTRTGVLKGKVAYMAPEQSAGQPIDRRADLFSVGVMLWEAVVGQRMWSKTQNDLQILHALMNGAIPRPRDEKPDIDPELERMILKATAPNAADRYGSALEFQGEIEAYLKGPRQPSVGPREIGKFLTELFAKERAQIKGVVDDQLRLLRGVGSGEHAAIDLPLLSTGSPSGTPSAVLLAGTPGSQPSIRVGSRPSLPSLRAPFDLPVQPSDIGPLAPLRRAGASHAVIVLAAAVAVLVVGGSTVLALRRSLAEPKGAEPASAPLPPGPAAVAPASPPLPAAVHALVTASPREARITIDDGPFQTGNFAGTFARDGKTHSIRVEAPEYEGKTLTFAADDDHAFVISLVPAVAPSGADKTPSPSPHASHSHERSETHAGPSSPLTPPAALPAALSPAEGPPAAPAPSTTAHAKQQIDTQDPYAN